MRALLVFSFLAMTGVVAAIGCGGGTECSTWADCQTSDEAEALRPCPNGNEGAIIHVNTACREGKCEAECATTCIPYGCGRDQVCDIPRGPFMKTPAISPSSVLSSCMKNPIACTTADDCPYEEPSESGEWTCDSSVCRFPGFAYLAE